MLALCLTSTAFLEAPLGRHAAVQHRASVVASRASRSRAAPW